MVRINADIIRDREHTTVLISGLAKGTSQALIESFFESVSGNDHTGLTRSVAAYERLQYSWTSLDLPIQLYSNSGPWNPLLQL